jgi:hypothetical protein
MANRYWVGGTGTWDATAGTKWATTSGGTGGSAVPTTADNVFFDANSGANTITIGSGTAICNALNINAFTGTLAFGTNSITISGNSAFLFSGGSGYTLTGTPLCIFSYSGATGTRTISPGGASEANSMSFNITSGTDTITASTTAGTATFKNLNLTGFAGTFANTVKTIYGDLTLPSSGSGATISAGVNLITFASTLVQQNITSNGFTMDFPITASGTQTIQLVGNLTIGSTRTFTFTSGNLNLNNNTLSCGIFSSTNSNTRSISFGTGNITVTGNAATVWNMATATGFTLTGTPQVNLTYSGSTGTRTIAHSTTAGSVGEVGAVSFTFSASGDAITINNGSYIKNLIFSSGSTNTVANATQYIYGNYTLASGMTITAGTSVTSLFSGLNQQNITTNGVTLDFPINIGAAITPTAITGSGSTVTVTYASTIAFPAVGSTITVANVVPSAYNGTFTVVSSSNTGLTYSSSATGTVTTFGTVSLASCTVQLQDAMTMGTSRTLTFNSGTLDLNSKTFTTGIFTATSSAPHSILFGTGTINVASNNANVWSNNSATSVAFTYTGTSKINCTYSGSVGTRVITSQQPTEANALNFYITAGSDNFQINGSRGYQTIDFTGFTGTFGIVPTSTGNATIYQNLVLPSAGTATFGANSATYGFTFGSATNSQTFTSNGYSLDTVIVKQAAGSLTLVGSLTLTSSVSTGQFTFTGGTFSTGGYALNCAIFNFQNTGTKTLTLTNSTVTISGGTSSSGFSGSNTNTTYNLTGSNIVFTSSATTFFNAPLGVFPQVTMGGTGTLTIGQASASNTITTLTNTTQPCTISLLATATQLNVTNFNVNGTAGNLVTLNSTVSGTQATISKTSGQVSVNYLNIQDSKATGGAAWDAYYSTDSGNNTGWFISSNLSNFLNLFDKQ